MTSSSLRCEVGVLGRNPAKVAIRRFQSSYVSGSSSSSGPDTSSDMWSGMISGDGSTPPCCASYSSTMTLDSKSPAFCMPKLSVKLTCNSKPSLNLLAMVGPSSCALTYLKCSSTLWICLCSWFWLKSSECLLGKMNEHGFIPSNLLHFEELWSIVFFFLFLQNGQVSLQRHTERYLLAFRSRWCRLLCGISQSLGVANEYLWYEKTWERGQPTRCKHSENSHPYRHKSQ